MLDFSIRTRRCTLCSSRRDTMTEEEFDLWYISHQESCEANHSGSSPSMELEGATEIFKRSAEKHGLRYTQVISDDDSKTITHLNDTVKPYREDVTIVKHECVGHIQKRVGTRLQALKKVCSLYYVFFFIVCVCMHRTSMLKSGELELLRVS